MASKIITPYSLPFGIEVISEYGTSKSNPYCRVKIRTHYLFDAKDNDGFQLVRRSRVVMTSVLGRKLLKAELVHHKNEIRSDDSPDNLQLITQKLHNKHHKSGSKHTKKTKNKISKGLNKAYKTGKKTPTTPDWTGKKHTLKSKQKMSNSHKKAISEGRINMPIPPVLRGESSNTAKLTEKDVLEIRKRAGDGESKTKLAKEFEVVCQSIYNIINRSTWKHIK